MVWLLLPGLQALPEPYLSSLSPGTFLHLWAQFLCKTENQRCDSTALVLKLDCLKNHLRGCIKNTSVSTPPTWDLICLVLSVTWSMMSLKVSLVIPICGFKTSALWFLTQVCYPPPSHQFLWITLMISAKVGAQSVPGPLYHLSVWAWGAIVPAIANKQEACGEGNYWSYFMH